MWDFIRQNGFLVAAATGSLATFLVTLLINHFKREKYWLGYSVAVQSIVANSTNPQLTVQINGQLKVQFNNQEIRRLDVYTIVVRNTGNRVLRKIPITVKPPAGGKFLWGKREGPPGVSTTMELKNAEALVTFDMLNPKESLSLTMAVADATSNEGVTVIARGEYLRVHEISDSELQKIVTDALEPTAVSLVRLMLKTVMKG